MTRETIKQIERDYWQGKEDLIDIAEVFNLAQRALEQESVLDKVRVQIEDLLKGLGMSLAILEKGDKLEPKLKGAIEAVEECINIIDKAESEET